jgi:hypothetical protein
VPKDAVSGVRAPLTGYASLNQIISHDFQSILYEVVGGKLRKFYFTATLQQANFITRLFTRYIGELKFIISNQSSRLFLKLTISNSKVPNRERSEEKLMPSVLKDRFLSLNSHIFFFVVDKC